MANYINRPRYLQQLIDRRDNGEFTLAPLGLLQIVSTVKCCHAACHFAHGLGHYGPAATP